MQLYCESIIEYKRLKTREVKIGDLLIGNFHPIRVQTMTTTDTMDTIATVEQSIHIVGSGLTGATIAHKSKSPPNWSENSVAHNCGYGHPKDAQNRARSHQPGHGAQTR